MDIQLIRIDDRLIHGQVVVGWVKALEIQRLVVVSDAVAANAMQRTLMEIAVPSGLMVSFHAVQDAANACSAPGPERSLLLFSNPSDVLAYATAGGPASSINIGGMHFSEGRRQVHRIVCVTDDDVKAFKGLKARGLPLEIRAVPGDASQPLEHCLPELAVP
jgi:mannose/fructose/sorbose-specific phosphotransferase system IIB component